MTMATMCHREVMELLRSEKSTSAIPSRFSSQKGGTNYLPYAFTE